MIQQSIVVMLFFVILVLSRRSSGSALGVIIASMLLWPEYLRIPMGIIEMSVPRMVALALLLKLFGNGRHKKVKYGKVDFLVFLLWLWTVIAAIVAGSTTAHVTSMIGRSLDTILMYFVARIAIQSPEDVVKLIKWLAFVALVMCAIGVVETTTSYSPYSSMINFRQWSWGFDKEDEYRFGFLRAKGSTAVHIYFGMSMMIIFGMLWATRLFYSGRLLYKFAILAALLAVMSSMSSGPWLGCILIIVFNLYSSRVTLIKPTIFFILLAAVVLELQSNRHFYNLIDYLALDPKTAWYRSRLLEVGIAQWRDYGFFGVGSNWPNHWSALIDGRGHVDVVNHFLLIALYGGILAVFMYISTHVIAIRSIIKAWHIDSNEAHRKFLFGLAAALIAIDVSSMSVGLFGPVQMLSHILLGCIISTTVVLSNYQSAQSESRCG